MSHAAKTNVYLFVIVIILSLIAWFQPGLHKSVFSYFSSFKSDEINTIIIDRQDIGQIKLKKQDDSWFLLEPYQLPANRLRVDTITDLAEKRSFSQFQVSDEELARYHLAAPLIAIWLNDSKFVIGSEDPIKQQRYAMNIDDNIHTGKNTVHMINGTVFYQLRANLNTFISPNLIPTQATIQSISWSDKHLAIDNGRWHLTPDAPNVTADSIAQLIQFWKKAQASHIEIRSEPVVPPPAAPSESSGNNNTRRNNTVSITLKAADSAMSSIEYLIIQEGTQIKLLRTDIPIAYLITPQILKLLTEFIRVPKNTNTG